MTDKENLNSYTEIIQKAREEKLRAYSESCDPFAPEADQLLHGYCHENSLKLAEVANRYLTVTPYIRWGALGCAETVQEAEEVGVHFWVEIGEYILDLASEIPGKKVKQSCFNLFQICTAVLRTASFSTVVRLDIRN